MLSVDSQTLSRGCVRLPAFDAPTSEITRPCSCSSVVVPSRVTDIGQVRCLQQMPQEGTGIEQLWNDAALPELPDIASYLGGDQAHATTEVRVHTVHCSWTVLNKAYELALPDRPQGDAQADGTQLAAPSAGLPAPSPVTAALAASAAGQIAARDGSEDAKPAPQQHKASATADADRTSLPTGNSEDDYGSTISETVPEGVHAPSAERQPVSPADTDQHQRHGDGAPRRHEDQQQPVPQADAAHSAADAEAELRSSPAGPSHPEGEQPEGWETLPNGTDGDGWDGDTSVAMVADGAESDGQNHSDDTTAGPPPGGTTPSAAALSETSARQVAPPDEPGHAAVTSYEAQPSTDAASAEDRSHQLAAVLEDANGTPADQPAADTQEHLENSVANGVAQPAPLANGLLEPVTLHDADVPSGPAEAEISSAADAGMRPQQCGL